MTDEMIYHGDVADLLENQEDESIDMIWGDPDYNVGIKYDGENYTTEFDSYMGKYAVWTLESLTKLKHDGNLFLMNYPRANAHLRVSLEKQYRDLLIINEYVWVYNTNTGHSPKKLTTAHRSILHITKSTRNKWYKDNIAVPYQNPNDKRIKKLLAKGSKGRMPYSWFEFNQVKNVSKDKIPDHPCQLPPKLFKMFMLASTQPQDLCLVLFGGVGTEVLELAKAGRRYATAELNKKYIDIINDRLNKLK